MIRQPSQQELNDRRALCTHPDLVELCSRWNTHECFQGQRHVKGVRFCRDCGEMESQYKWVHDGLWPELAFEKLVDYDSVLKIDCGDHEVLLEIALKPYLERLHALGRSDEFDQNGDWLGVNEEEFIIRGYD